MKTKKRTDFVLMTEIRARESRSNAKSQPPKLDAETAKLLDGLPQPLTEAALWQWIQRTAEHPTAAGAHALAHLSEFARAVAPDAAVVLARLSEAITRSVDSKQASATLATALKETVDAATTLGRRLGRKELEQELAADATRPVLERHVEFVADGSGRITGKIEKEYRAVQARAEGGLQGVTQ